jgi:von Willebrand factor type A domain/Aerotolerance regulator N-terminal
MSLLNLSLGELAALFGTIAGLLVTLYLLDRSRRRQVVATLRFWTPATDSTEIRQKRRIQQPWSLLLQVLSMALLLLAIAELVFGGSHARERDFVLVLDTSAWMDARVGNGTLMDQARRSALQWLKSVPAADRVMVVRADALPTPVTPMETSRKAAAAAIRDSQPGATALNLDQALSFAERVERQRGAPGEIVYIGSGRVEDLDGASAPLPPNLRVVPIDSPAENVGIRKIGLRRSASEAGAWDVFVSVKNYGTEAVTAPLAVTFAGAPVGSRALVLKPGAEMESTFRLRTSARGWLEARLGSQDAFPDDNRAELDVPAQPSMKVVVYTAAPALLRPVLPAGSAIAAVFRPPAAYRADPDADAVILDRFMPPELPTVPSIWIAPPAGRSPVAVGSIEENARLARWNSDSPLGTGLHTKDLELASAEVFLASPDDIKVAETDRGPVIIARPKNANSPKLVVMGFHPMRSAMRYELATPLLFANVLRWIDPDVFRTWELNAGTPGNVEVTLDPGVDPETVSVSSDSGERIPFTIDGGRLRMFAGAAGDVTVKAGDRKLVYSLTLPDPGDAVWTIPPGVKRGIARTFETDIPATELWPWLALAGGFGLWLEWVLFGRARRKARVRASARRRERVIVKKAS